MANVSAPIGLVPMGNAGGAAPNFELAQNPSVVIAKTDATVTGYGDLLKKLSSGYVTRWTAGTAANLMAGVFAGCKYYSISQQRIVQSHYWPGSDALNDPLVFMYPITGTIAPRFWIQSNSGGPVVFGNVNNNIDLVMGTVNTTNGFSGAMADFSTIATTNTLPFHIEGLYSSYQTGVNGSDNTTAYNRIIVTANVGALAGV